MVGLGGRAVGVFLLRLLSALGSFVTKAPLSRPSSKVPDLPRIQFPTWPSCLLKPPGGKVFPQLLIAQPSFLAPLSPPTPLKAGPSFQSFLEPSELLLLPAVTLTGTVCTKSCLRDV